MCKIEIGPTVEVKIDHSDTATERLIKRKQF